MAKPSPVAAFHTPRLRSTRASVGPSSSSSSSGPKVTLPTAIPRDVSSNAKVVAKCLAYDDNFAFTDPPPDDDLDLDPLLELPDPADDESSTTPISVAPDDAVTASADSAFAEVAAPAADSTTAEVEEPLPEQINLVLAELHGARGLSPRSKRLLAALAEVAAAELSSTATALRLRRAALWGKVRVGVLAVTVAAVAAIDIALAVALMRGGNGHYHVLPPT